MTATMKSRLLARKANSRIAYRLLNKLKFFAYERANKAYREIMWQERDKHQAWENVRRFNLFLARRRVYAATGEMGSVWPVRAHMPFLGPKATPEKVIDGLRKVDKALTDGVFEMVDDLDDDMEVGPYDGPFQGTTVLAGQPDGTNVPSNSSRTMKDRVHD